MHTYEGAPAIRGRLVPSELVRALTAEFGKVRFRTELVPRLNPGLVLSGH